MFGFFPATLPIEEPKSYCLEFGRIYLVAITTLALKFLYRLWSKVHNRSHLAPLGSIHPDHLVQYIIQLQIKLYPIDTVLAVINATPSLDLPQAFQLPLYDFLLVSLPNSGQCYIPGVQVLNICIDKKPLLII